MGVAEQDWAYIARCKCGCGGIVCAIVDKPAYAETTAQEVAELIRAGYTVERETCANVRATPWGCQRQQKLPFRRTS